jgi:hypothetical protein
VSSGFAVDEDWLRLIPTSVNYMAFNFLSATRLPAVALAMGALVSGCGGGGGGASDPEATQASVSSSATVASTVGASTAADVGSTSTSVTVDIASSPSTDSSTADALAATVATVATVASTSVSGDTLPTIVASAAPSTGGLSSGATPMTTTGSTAKSARSGAGLNVGGLGYASPELPTIDLMKRAGAWLTQCGSAALGCKDFAAGQSGWETLEEAKLDLDAQGWVKSLPASNDATVKYRWVTTAISAGAIPDGSYVVKYDGQGTVTYSGGSVKVAAKSAPGRDVVQYTSVKGGFFVSINATTTSNYVRNIQVFPPGGACANDYSTFASDATACGGSKGTFVAFESFPATKPWYPQFVTDVKGFRTLRYMDWMKTNTTLAANWSERALPTDRIWTGVNGAPLETIIDISNDTATDPWVNIPPHATDDYVHQFARLAHQRLSPTLKLNLEYSNEPWNYSFAAAGWMLAQGKATWPTQAAQGANVYYLELNWYAQRLAQVCTIARQEFGADASRVTCIANTQAALTNGTEQTLACTYAAATLGKPCAKFFDAVAIAPYFGFYISLPAYRPTVTTWYTDADGGLTKLFEEIDGADPAGKAMTAPLAAISKFPGGSRGMSSSWMTSTKAIADKYGLPMWAYEGGQHLVAPAGDTDAAFLNLIAAANVDPRMQTAYQQDLADWKAAGGQTFSYYSHVATPSKYGMWGAKSTMDDNNAPKWKALLQARDGTSCWWAGC